MGGGLDQASSALAIKPGRLTECLNFEEKFGEQGYWGIAGYERYNGKQAPSTGTYYVLAFNLGNAEILAADAVTGPSGSATVVLVNLTSGTYAAGNAVGTLIIMLMTGSWLAGEVIQVGAATKATATAAPVLGSIAQSDHQTSITATRTALRARIDVVPGSGSVLGVAVYQSVLYAVRNIADGTSATLWKSSSAGWTSIKTGLIPSGAWKFEVANFSGASTTVALFGVDGKNRLFKWDGTTFTKALPIYGTEAVSVTSVTIATGAQTFVHSGTARGWVAGDALTVWDADDAANSMTGTVTSYTSGTSTLVLNVTSITGSGTKINWEIGKTSFSDKPYVLTAHKDHLMLAYPLGQLQTSNLGDPMLYTTTAALFGLGADITGLVSLKGAVLGVFCREKISILTGTSATTWSMALHSEGAGAINGTVSDNVGNAMFLDDKGVLSLQSTQAFGDFESASLSREVKRFLDARIGMVTGARFARSSNQYRLYFSDGVMLRLTIRTANPSPMPADVGVTRQTYPDVPTCFASGTLTTGGEGLFFGTASGYVMQEDAGTSFDGVAIQYVMRLPFNHFKTPTTKKRYHKLEFEMYSPDALDISYRLLYDYDDGVNLHGDTATVSAAATGGQYDVSTFETFQFDRAIHNKAEVSISGVGRNLAPLIYVTSSYVRPFAIQGLITHFTPLGIQR